ncbi:hypothetical protein EWB00_000248 [Schistosoma japonicum]|uniref:Uncharacterized protein n=1 Tax=Schistosoma japonicum TaxID=6182 RepID=A0A4Z2DJD1_SCHJA|nr:hypothetical protein EWB00_000248 [Schistosoma japonicum]
MDDMIIKKIRINCNNQMDQISNYNLETNLSIVVSRVPGSFWWYDPLSVGSDENIKMYYWLRIPNYILSTNNDQKHNHNLSKNNHSNKLLARLLLIHYNESIIISDVQLTPQNQNQIICIDCYVPQNGGHWKVIWSDLNRKLKLCSPLDGEIYDLSKTLMISQKPIQLGPGLRFIGWASGHSYSSNSNDDTLPGCETYSWCFIIPININRLYNVTVFLLIPESKDENVNPPTHSLQSTQLDRNNNINLRDNNNCQLHKTEHEHFTQIKQSKLNKTINLNNNHFSFTLSLFGFKCKLVVITESDHYQRKSTMNSIGVDSICSLDSLDYRYRVGDKHKFCQYTHIKTQSGNPAYKNGAFIDPFKKDFYEEEIKSNYESELFNNQSFILDHINEMNSDATHFISCKKHNVTINCDSSVVSVNKHQNGLNSKCYTEVYPVTYPMK